MKKIISLVLLVFGLLLISSNQIFAQKGKAGGGGHHQNIKPKGKTKVVVRNNHHSNKSRVVVRSPYRPKVLAVYHPHWAKKHSFNRRWVYFPNYNFYWDNWRQIYVYRTGTVWMTNPNPPAIVVNITIENEQHYELKENEDDIDDVYKINDSHQSEYNPR